MIGVLCVVLAFHGLAPADDDFFETHVRPLLARRCFECHGENKQESDLRLDARASVLQGGASGDAAAVPGEPDASLLIRYARREVEGMEMPPDEPLTGEEVAVLEQWISAGMEWAANTAPAAATLEERLKRDRASHWAFQRPIVQRPPGDRWPAELRAWVQTRLDEFTVDKLVEHAMTPSPSADRKTLIRRLKYDLLGLPPTPEEVNGFLEDDAPNAYARLVDRYLASPHYGERWGRHWLDVARYADTRGYTFGGADRNYPFAYTYRDYVIDALNQDVPYDEFVVQQLAADQLELGEDNRPLAALGFLTVGRKFNNTHDDIDDRIDVVTRGLQGLTVACARCHDHKYDAIPTEDYYSLYGVFDSSREPARLPLIGDAATLARNRRFEQQFNTVNDRLARFDDQLVAEISKHAHTSVGDYFVAVMTGQSVPGLRPQLIDGWRKLLRRKAKPDDPVWMPWFQLKDADSPEFARAAAALAETIATRDGEFLNPFVRQAFVDQPPTSKRQLAELYGRVLLEAYDLWQTAGGGDAARKRQPADVRQLLWYFADFNSPAAIQRSKIKDYLSESEKDQRNALQAEVDAVRNSSPSDFHRAMVLLDKESPTDAYVFIRGTAGRNGKQVPRQSPLLVAPGDRLPFQHGSGRLELARDIASHGNPLTARVLVNRLWLHHFGKPLVPTPSDFGVRCAEPVHRKLLDYLAVELMRGDWSVKSLHREILLSATYQQSSGDRPDCYAVDPENRLLWRMNRRRLEFEVLRDSVLSASGELDLTFGGKPARIFRQPEGGRRRSVYGYIDRQDLPNLLRVFDFASPDQSASKRPSTMVPQQALFLLNSPFVMRHARRLANALANASQDTFIETLYQQLFSRAPSSEEREIASQFLQSSSQSSEAARASFAQLLFLTNEFSYVD